MSNLICVTTDLEGNVIDPAEYVEMGCVWIYAQPFIMEENVYYFQAPIVPKNDGMSVRIVKEYTRTTIEKTIPIVCRGIMKVSDSTEEMKFERFSQK